MQTIVHLVENDWAGCGFTFLILDRECLLKVNLGLPWWLSGKVAICQCRRHGFDPWLGKIPHATEQLSQSVTATEPVLWSRRTATTESSCRSYWGLFTLECEDFAMKSPRTPTESRPRSLQLGKSPHSNAHTAQPKIKTNNEIIFQKVDLA